MSESMAGTPARRRPVWNATRDVLRLAQPRARWFLPGLAAGVASAVCAVALLASSAWLITRAAEQPPILYLSMAVVGVRAFALGRSAFRYLDRLVSHDAAFRQLSLLRVGVFSRIVPLAPAGLADTGRGELLTRLVRDVDALQDLPLRVVQPLATAGILAAVSVVGVWSVLPLAGLTLLLSLVAAGLLGTLGSGLLAARAERELAPLRGDLTGRVLEVVENLDVLTAFGALPAHLAALRHSDELLRRATLRRSLGVGVQGAVLALFAGAATVAALAAGIPALAAQSGAGPAAAGLAGPAFAVIVLVPMAVFEVFGVVPAALGAWREVRSSAQRVATVVPAQIPTEIPIETPVGTLVGTPVDTAVDTAVEIPADTSVGIPADIRAGGSAGVGAEGPAGAGRRAAPVVELTDLGASWPGAAVPAVTGVSLRLAPGDRVHLAGPSGAGKTTLAQALVRFLDYTGSYTLGGVEARLLPQAEVRTVVGLCEQRPWLFDDSIRQNLLFARDTASDDELLAVIARVGLADWAAERGGLDARVGERGALVSGGQAQRIALARALLADFPVLVVDEPTANVDEEQGDRLVRDILAAAAEDGRAVLLISHTPVPDELITARVNLTGEVHGRRPSVGGLPT